MRRCSVVVALRGYCRQVCLGEQPLGRAAGQTGELGHGGEAAGTQPPAPETHRTGQQQHHGDPHDGRATGLPAGVGVPAVHRTGPRIRTALEQLGGHGPRLVAGHGRGLGVVVCFGGGQRRCRSPTVLVVLGQRHPDRRDVQPSAQLEHLGQHFPCVVEPGGRIPAGGAQHQVVELGRQAGDALARGGGVGVDVLICHREGGVAGVGRHAGQHLVEQHPRGVHIAAGIRAAGADLLGGQVGGRAQDHAACGGPRGSDRADQSEIGDLHRPVRRDQDVLGLDVAMDQPGPVCGGQGSQCRFQHAERQGDRQRTTFVEQLTQGAALDQFHHQEYVSVIAALVVDGHQPGVTEPGHRAGLQLEAAEKGRIVGEAGVHHLDCYRAVQPQVDPPIDGGHAAAGDDGVNPVAPLQQHSEQCGTAAHPSTPHSLCWS